MTTLEVLRGARAKVARGWCQGVYAVNAEGSRVLATAEDAERWCVLGSISATAGDELAIGGDAYCRLFYLVRDALFNQLDAAWRQVGLSGWNDAEGRTQADVLALFDRAIAAEEAKS